MDKQSSVRLLDETFGQNYNRDRFCRFIKEVFNRFDINVRTWGVWSQYEDYIERFSSLGTFHDKNDKIIEILEVQLKKTSSRDRARTMQRNFIASFLKKYMKDAALIAFYGDDPSDWRFSFVKMDYNLVRDETGKVTIDKELTPAKRYSYLVGVHEPNHTCRNQFLDFIVNEELCPVVSDIEDAFSIDTVTKEFFEKYKELVLDLKESLIHVIDNDKKIVTEFEERGIEAIDFAKKLLGQIVFLYFLQKKGWLGVEKDKEWGSGPRDFLRRLFGDKKKGIQPRIQYTNFFNEILEPLFYDALSNPRPGDDGYYVHFKCKIPFLNGGLFEPINDYDWAGPDITIDNSVFEKIFETFDRFNFTVKEDEPLEKEVAVDPEMLGKVFENLLEVKERKDKGAFYTPREIVHYMCQQSLINYLETNTDIERKDIEIFIQYGDLALEYLIQDKEKQKKNDIQSDVEERFLIPPSISNNYGKIDRLLQEIKIVDPAVGSGAFPIGMMNEIVKARSILSVYFPEDERKNRTNYDFKRKTIEDSLYGVDIDVSAVEIAKLRFWLSLIVDETKIDKIKPLPNLDHKIMCGNSLLEEFEGIKLFDEKLLGSFKKNKQREIQEINEQIIALNTQLSKLRSFIERKKISGEIKKLKNKIDNLEKKSATDQISLVETESEKKIKKIKSLQKRFFNEQNRNVKRELRAEIDNIEWELIEATLKEQNHEDALDRLEQYKKTKVKPFFLWKLYFAEVFLREKPGFDVVIANPPYVNIANLSVEHRLLYKKRFTVTKNKVDLYAYFIELGNEILRPRGSLTFIVPHTWKATSSFENLRRLIFNNFQMMELVELTDKTFEATVKPVVIVLRKEIVSDYNIVVLNDSFEYLNNIPLKEVLSKQDYSIDTLSSGKDKDLFLKIENNSLELGKVLKFTRGIKTSNDKRFVSDKPFGENNHLLIKGRDVYKWHYVWNGEYIWYRPDLMRDKVGCLPHTSDLFEVKEKLILQRISRGIVASYDTKQIFSLDTTLVSVNSTLKQNVKMKYVLALLNSLLLNFWYEKKFILPTVSGYELHQIPIKISTNQEVIIKIVDQILSISKDSDYLDNPDKKTKVKLLEKEIDQLVYKLYELTPEEIEIVEDFVKEKNN